MTSIKKGNIVSVLSDRYCFARYSQFALRHPQYMLRWAYGHDPRKDHYYRVLGVYKNMVVIQDTQCRAKRMNPIYFMDVEGLKVENQEN